MSTNEFVPHHVNACPLDLAGNQGLGRYVFLPGSDGRAREIAQHFSDVRKLESARCHNIYLGTLEHRGMSIDVASVSSGMGTPSLDIIMHEMFKLGCRRFLRVGTAGSMQPWQIRVGNLVVATGAVRDENASRLYVPPEFPSIASREMVDATLAAAAVLGLEERLYPGIVHSKDSLFAREFGEGPMREENRRYMKLLEEAGVSASEMESSHLFILATLFTRQLAGAGKGAPADLVLAGSILGIIGDDRPFAPKDEVKEVVGTSVLLAVQTVRELAAAESA